VSRGGTRRSQHVRAKREERAERRRVALAERRWSGGGHRQVRVEHEGTVAYIDEGIAALVLALWRRGFQTFASCESWSVFGGAAYVSLGTGDEQREFEEIVGSVSRVVAHGEPDEEVAGRMATDPAYAEDVAAKGGVWAVGFPSEDIPAVLAEVQQGQNEKTEGR
jgi:hypothetical protein